MLNPKEKAQQLYNKYYQILCESSSRKHDTLECALIMVDEILNINSVDKDYFLSNYWEEVKQEIEKL